MYTYKTSQRLAHILAAHDRAASPEIGVDHDASEKDHQISEKWTNLHSKDTQSTEASSAPIPASCSHINSTSNTPSLHADTPERDDAKVNPPPPTRPPFTRQASPDFDARAAANALKSHEGYVSFGDINGLGCPSPDIDDSSEHHASSLGEWLGKLAGPYLGSS